MTRVSNDLVVAIAICACIAFASPALAQTTHGVGTTTCAQFLRAARSGDILYHQASNWLLGYVSGMNAGLAAGGAGGAVTLTNDQLMKSAGDYCEANLTKTIAQAAGEWYQSVPRQPAAAAEPAAAQPGNYDHLKKPFSRPLDRR